VTHLLPLVRNLFPGSGSRRRNGDGHGGNDWQGVPLDGDKIVRLVYIDEAGISKATEEPILVVAGTIVHGDHSLNGVENELERIMLRHIPERHRDGFVFHAKELFNGGGNVFKRVPPPDFIGPIEWSLERRLKIADEIMAIPKKFKLPIAIGWIDKAAFLKRLKLPAGIHDESEITIAGHIAAFMNCAMWVEQYMRRETKGENCLFVVENNDQVKKFLTEVHRYHQDKKKFEVVVGNNRKHFPLRKITKPAF
jgi:hypothetical protein